MWFSATDDRSSTYTVGPFKTAIVFSPEVDMILLDGAWWRCSRDGDLYTVREKVANDPSA
jgi:hypothetical protein